MKKIIIAAHGKMAHYLLEAVKNLIGKVDGVYALSLQSHQSASYLRKSIERILGEKPGDDVFILTDFPGGSPCNSACAFLVHPRVKVIAGVNMPMLVELILKRNKLSAEEAVEAAIKAGRDSIMDVGRELCMCEIPPPGEKGK